jgi:hypothetical protein
MDQGSAATPWAEGLRQAEVLADDEFQLSESVALWKLVDEAPDAWRITTRPLVPAAPPKRCSLTSVLLVAGIGRTLANGQREFLVRDFICPTRPEFEYSGPAILLATATEEDPVFLTAKSEFTVVNSNEDLRLRFLSWDATGQPAPVSFRWHLTAAVTRILP